MNVFAVSKYKDYKTMAKVATAKLASIKFIMKPLNTILTLSIKQKELSYFKLNRNNKNLGS